MLEQLMSPEERKQSIVDKIKRIKEVKETTNIMTYYGILVDKGNIKTLQRLYNMFGIQYQASSNDYIYFEKDQHYLALIIDI